MDISKGSLDEISRPPSNRSRQGSQASSKMFGSAQAINRRLIESPGTFQVLNPDNSEECDIIEVEDYSGASDLDDFTDDADEFFESEEGEYSDVAANEAETPEASGGVKPSLPTQQLDSVEYYLSKQIVIAGYNGDNDDVDVDSEEERDICREIKEEIKRQVKGEMQEELKVYELPEKKEGTAAEDRDADLVHLEPKLRDAIIKMRKLDRILLKKMKKEKEVKTNRMRLTKRLREELDELSRENRESGKTELKEVKNNTFKFLALAPPPSHNEGITLDDDDDEPPITPVFRTQIPDQDFQTSDVKDSSRPRGNRSRVESNRSEDSRASGPLGSELGNSTCTSQSRASKNSKKSSKGKKKNQDFIKRNIQLASDAANPIAMTDDEKNRLEDLLKTMDMETIAEEQSDENPFQLVVPPGEGYAPAPEDQKTLEDIDKQLKLLMAPDEFEAMKSPRGTNFLQHCLFTRTDMRSSVDVDKLGEQALTETKEERDMRVRMEQIEKDLASLSIHADLEFPTPVLSEDHLQMLLGQYARSVASSASYLDTISENGELITERSEVESVDIYENPPILPENVLQQLLSEAREQLMSDEHARTPNTPNESDDRKVEKILNTARDELAMDSLTDEQIQELLRSARESSRSSSRSTLRPNSSSEILTQRNDLSHRDRDEDRIILPEINHTNSIVAQKLNNTERLNNQAKKSNSERRSANMESANVVWNSFSEDRLSSRRGSNGRNSTSSLNGLHFDGHSPRPPVSDGSLGPSLLNGQAHSSRSAGQGHSARSPRSTQSRGQNGSGRPRNLQPISTRLDLDLSDEEF